jgi:hypothetical protein
MNLNHKGNMTGRMGRIGRIGLMVIALAIARGSGLRRFSSTAGKVLGTAAQSTDAAMKGWAAYVVAGGATTNQETQVRALYAKYQATMGVATNAFTAAVVTGDKTPWQAASAALQASASSLITVIQIFSTTPSTGPPIPQ